MRNYSDLPERTFPSKKITLLEKSSLRKRQGTDVGAVTILTPTRKKKNTPKKHLDELLFEMKDLSQNDFHRTEETEAQVTDKRTSDITTYVGPRKKSPKRPNTKRKNSEQEKELIYKDETYDIWDLTYTFISGNIPLMVTGLILFLIVVLRYYTLACLVYIGIKSDAHHLIWLVVVAVVRVLYFILVVKISLKTAQTRTELSLKKYWNSQESDFNEFFQVIDNRKLLTSFFRGIIPAELSFIYIKANPIKRFEIYVAINYIYCSIEAIVYYPFFIAYTSVLSEDDKFGLNEYYGHSTLALAVLAELIMIGLSTALLFIGIRRKYLNFCFCCKPQSSFPVAS